MYWENPKYRWKIQLDCNKSHEWRNTLTLFWKTIKLMVSKPRGLRWHHSRGQREQPGAQRRREGQPVWQQFWDRSFCISEEICSFCQKFQFVNVISVMALYLCLLGFTQPVPELPSGRRWYTDLTPKGVQGKERVFLPLESWPYSYPSAFYTQNCQGWLPRVKLSPPRWGKGFPRELRNAAFCSALIMAWILGGVSGLRPYVPTVWGNQPSSNVGQRAGKRQQNDDFMS